uniref:C1 family peptidase n=1 Tax=Methanobrevibacter sp. TaxID=66852 RepID=UPI00388FDAC1
MMEKKISIDKDNFVINGNNHIIDGNGQVSIFFILGKNVTINNLKFVNGHSIRAGGAIVAGTGSLTLNNVTFINNSADLLGGDVAVVEDASVNIFNCNFIDSYSYHGSALYLEAGAVNIEYSNFTSKYFSHWGLIFTNQIENELFIDNCIFNNISSAYTPAVFAQDSYVTINNTKFNNLKANESVGAVAIRTPKQAIIENCLFVNTTSTKNAGALFIDIEGEGDEPITEPITVTVRNLTFNNVSSGFGGAFVQLTGNLTLEDSSFTNCSAVYAGGAAYLSNVIAEITNCKFNSNKVVPQPNYQTSGGALYFDYGVLNIADSEFNNNNASMASGILIYDSEYHLDNITFNNNNNPVYTYFDGIGSTIGQVYGSDTISQGDLNNTYYLSVILGEGMKLNLTANNIDLTTLPARFDLREIGWITPVRDQGNMGSCWSFGGVAAFESALLKNTGRSYDISENNMQDSMLVFSRYGSDEIESGNEMIAAAYFLSWLGAFPQEYDIYDELGKLSPVIHTNQTIHLQDFVLIDDRNISIPGDPALKKAILKYGALTVLYDGEQEPEAYNPTTGAFYHLTGPTNHAVALAGWDDNYPKENFATIPDGDGAWIIKNSWGTQSGDGGYMYVSYYDGTLCPDDQLTRQAVAYVFENTMPYNKNYQYDFTGIKLFVFNDETCELYGTPVTNVNNFVSAEDDLIAAVGTYFNQSGMDYTVKVAVNGAVVYTQNGVSPYRGYHTIKLDKYIPIKKGDKFSIYVTSMALGMSIPKRMHYETGVSLTNGDDGIWKDSYQTYGFVACIKAYTLKDDTTIIDNKNIVVDYGGGEYFSVKVKAADGHVVVGACVNFTINGKTIAALTDDDGIAKFEINEVPGVYPVTTSYNNQTYKNKVTVVLDLSTCKVIGNKDITVDYNSDSHFAVRVVSADGKVAASGVPVTFKINGKASTVKTDKNGIASFKLPLLNPGVYPIETIY